MFWAAPAWAGRSDGVQPLDRILSQMRSNRGGTFYDADGPFPDSQGNMHYRIKWLTPEGRLIWLDTDARTGRVLGVENNNNFRDPAGEIPRDRNSESEPQRRQFDNDRGGNDEYNDGNPRENFPRDPRWPRWNNGNPVGPRDHGDFDERGRGHRGHD